MPVALTDQEKIVLNVVREYLDKNRYFNMKKILPFISFRFKLAKININQTGIGKILKSLVEKNLFVDGSKLNQEDILNNSKRHQIYQFILNNPGAYLNRIMLSLELANHIVVWHVEILLKFNLIQKIPFDNKEIFFTKEHTLESVKKNYLLTNAKVKRIINFLLANTSVGFTKTHLGELLKMHPNTITKYLDALEEINVVYKQQNLKKIEYYLNQEFINFINSKNTKFKK
jgi:predicted transcriptional regulator